MTQGAATFSEDRLHRYTLDRYIGGMKGMVTWICLNPSTATAEVDDPTIRRCIGFSRLWDERFVLIGMSNHARVLYVVHAVHESNDVVRIISARLAEKKEALRYAAGGEEL